MAENKLVWIAVLFVAVVAWLVISKPAYDKQVYDLGERIKDHVASIEQVKQGMDRFDARWHKY